METMPKHVIKKLFLYLSHPTADIVKDETIFKFMALRNSDSDKTKSGSPYICGCTDTWDPEGRFNSRKYERDSNGIRHHNTDLPITEHREYLFAYLHGGHSIYNPRLTIQIDWSIKENGIRFPGDCSNSSSDEYAMSDSD